MSDERRRVLDLLAQGKITVDEADQLLRALGTSGAAEERAAPAGEATKPRFMRIALHKAASGEKKAEDVNIRVPLPFLKSGMRWGALLPGYMGEKFAARMRERGLDFNWSDLDPAAIDAIFTELNEMGIDIESEKSSVRITCE